MLLLLSPPLFFVRSVLTGSYSNTFHIYDSEGKTDVPLQADKGAFKTGRRPGGRQKLAAVSRDKGNSGENGSFSFGLDELNFSKKILHASWHPQENTVAVAAANNLFVFK